MTLQYLPAFEVDKQFNALARQMSPKALTDTIESLEQEQRWWEAIRESRITLVQEEENFRQKIKDSQLITRATLEAEFQEQWEPLVLAYRTHQITLRWEQKVLKEEKQDFKASQRQAAKLVTYQNVILPALRRFKKQLEDVVEEEVDARLLLEQEAWGKLWEYRVQFDPYSLYMPHLTRLQEAQREVTEFTQTQQFLERERIYCQPPQLTSNSVVWEIRNWKGKQENEFWQQQQHQLSILKRQKHEDNVMWGLVRSTLESRLSIEGCIQEVNHRIRSRAALVSSID